MPFDGSDRLLSLRSDLPMYFNDSIITCNGTEASLLECPIDPTQQPLNKRNVGHATEKRGDDLPQCEDGHIADAQLHCERKTSSKKFVVVVCYFILVQTCII